MNGMHRALEVTGDHGNLEHLTGSTVQETAHIINECTGFCLSCTGPTICKRSPGCRSHMAIHHGRARPPCIKQTLAEMMLIC